MNYTLYSIKDKKSDFAAPIPGIDDETAKRWFDHEVKNNSFMTEYREDFDFYKIGTFDAETGVVEKIPFPEFLMSAEEVKIFGREETIQNNS